MRRSFRTIVAAALLALAPAVALPQALPSPRVITKPANDNSNAAASTGYVDSAAQILLNAISGKLDKAGGTLTGPLSAPSGSFTGAVTAGTLAGTDAGLTGKATGALVARLLADRFRDSINVVDEMGIGETADAAINRAIQKAAARGGGQVIIPNLGAAYSINATVVTRAGVELIGLGNPTLRLANGVNDTLIESLGFKDLIAGGAGNGQGGETGMSVSGLILDGNRQNNTAPVPNGGHGLALWGRNLNVQYVRIRDAARQGLHTDYRGGSLVASTNTGGYDGRVSNVTVYRTGEEGWVNGASDLHANDINVTTASQSAHNTYDAIQFLDGGAVRGSNINVWRSGFVENSHRYALNIESGSNLSNVHLETSGTANLRVGGSLNLISNLYSYNLYGTFGTPLFGPATSHLIVEGAQNQITGLHMAGGPAAIQLGVPGKSASLNTIRARTSNVKGPLLSFVNPGNGNIIEIGYYADATTRPLVAPVSGTPGTRDTITMRSDTFGDPAYFGGRFQGAVVGGQDASAGATNAIALGINAQADVERGIAIGSSATARNSYSVALGNGSGTDTANEISMATGRALTSGDRSTSIFSVFSTTTDATPKALTGVLASTIAIPANAVIGGQLRVIGARSDGTSDSIMIEWPVVVSRQASGNAVLRLGTKAAQFGMTTVTGVDASAAVSGTSLVVTVTGAAGTGIAWSATLSGLKVKW
jgi:hypothetical protein